ncbi:MAG: hypothetical protein ACQETE_09575 [Bacteroidota bacterium]
MKTLAQQAKSGATGQKATAGSNPGSGKAATFSLQLKGSHPQHMVYSRSGQLMRLGTLQGQLNIKESTFAALLAQKWSRSLGSFSTGSGAESNTAPLTARQSDALAATLLQQSFDMIQDLFKKRKEKKKKRQGKHDDQQEQDSEAEEQALDLLTTLLEYAEDADDPIAFCKWAEQSIQRAREEMEQRVGANKLPESTQQMFTIMDDAVEALRHGVEPSFIFSRLKEEIQ